MSNGLAINDTPSHAASNAPRQSFMTFNAANIFKRFQLPDRLFVASLIAQLKFEPLKYLPSNPAKHTTRPNNYYGSAVPAQAVSLQLLPRTRHHLAADHLADRQFAE